MEPNNFDVHALIVAGGKGSRSENPLQPKILQEIQPGKSLISFHLENLRRENISKVTFLLGYKANQVIEELNKLQKIFPDIEINSSVEDQPRGTYGSVHKASQGIRESKLVVIYGDILINANYSKLLEIWSRAKTAVAVIVHPHLHPEDSDLVLTDENNLVILAGKQVPEILNGTQPLRAMAGVYFVDRTALKELPHGRGDFTKDFLTRLIPLNSLLAINSSDFFSDTGTSKRLANAREAIESGNYFRRGNSRKVAVFIDRDGTIVEDVGTGRKDFLPSEMENAIAKQIQALNRIGVITFIVTNQPGVAKGQIDLADVNLVQKKIEIELLHFEAIIDDFAFCPHHPDKGYSEERPQYKTECKCRKPGTKMVDDLSFKHNIDLSKSYLVGDTWRDEDLAAAAKLEFHKIEVGNRVNSLAMILNNIVLKVLG